MNYDVTIKTLPERQVASVRQILPCYDREGDLWHIFGNPSPHASRTGEPGLCIASTTTGSTKRQMWMWRSKRR